MREGKLVHLTLDGIKKAVSKYGTFPMIQPGGYVLEDATFQFNEPATEEEIRKLESHFNVSLPKDYKEFLALHNGMEFLDGIEILSIEDVVKYNETEDLPEKCFLIGYHFVGRYVIDSNRYENGDLDYLFYLDSIDHFDEAEDLKSNFEIWFDRLLSSNGTKYWELERDVKAYYKNIN
ncbi:SMI1/KNR4 family protein [Bacillus atrophaeus]|uniref:SMI1/KNR4 family protein n=1 Tax=Bacillus atrophaeus TaxID=1452 RepID=UPI0007C49E24|nr:SMI1/KNR4 family protein [Bacillus atrophaeus]WFE12460.1 SMI1/KNR4 family protein [Bacillus atrophaeus]